MTAVTVVVVEAEAAAAVASAVVAGGAGSGANGSEICASEGTEASAARESTWHQTRNKWKRRKGKDKRYTRLQMIKVRATIKICKSLKTEVYR